MRNYRLLHLSLALIFSLAVAYVADSDGPDTPANASSSPANLTVVLPSTSQATQTPRDCANKEYPGLVNPTLSGLWRKIRKHTTNLVGMVHYGCWDSEQENGFTVVASNPIRDDGYGHSRTDYTTSIEVFDKHGKRTDGTFGDRVQEVSAWRPSASTWLELLVVKEFISGTTYFHITPHGKLEPWLRLDYDHSVTENEYIQFVVMNRFDPERNSFVAVVPAKLQPKCWFCTTSGNFWLWDCVMSDGREPEKLTSGFFVIKFGKRYDNPVSYVPQFRIESLLEPLGTALP